MMKIIKHWPKQKQKNVTIISVADAVCKNNYGFMQMGNLTMKWEEIKRSVNSLVW